MYIYNISNNYIYSSIKNIYSWHQKGL